MDQREFKEYLADNAFKHLFIEGLGWDKVKGSEWLDPIEVEGVEYEFKVVARKNVFQAVVCEVEKLPQPSVVRRIDSQLRRQVNDFYISVYVEKGTPFSHLWVVPVKLVDKRDLVSISYGSFDQANFLWTKLSDLSFGLQETPSIVAVKERVNKAFAVNSERITKDFYTGFRKEHKSFAEFVTGIDDGVPAKDNRNKQWYASVMLNRLMFCYFIQKKGFLDGNMHYLRDKLSECQARKEQGAFFKTFYQGFLRELFMDGLNSPKHHDSQEFREKYGRIPYLNGGMFDRHDIEKQYADIDIADEAFERLFAFFDKWNWHLDTRVTASGKDINPDVLGYIFEQYINDRAQMGAYYTKEDITEYIGRNTIMPFLFDKVKSASKPMATMFEPEGYVWKSLQESGNRYIFSAVKQGYTEDWRSKIPTEISVGLDTSKPGLLERRKEWNTKTPAPWALPTEIWRETVERLQRCEDILCKIRNGEIAEINDFITYNLDIRQFASDLICKADNVQFVYNFYDALRNISVLDPTCGSGAFLFAAMNILEPLYYDCITRMRELDPQRKNRWVKEALDEIESRHRSNDHYFIFKSIILRNLYGVDIMAEATEIAKLRLFLKMVAVVDVDPFDKNLGLDPLPDIDFNIRCGNTLVGYANQEEIERDLNHPTDFLQIIANDQFRAEIKESMEKVAAQYRIFKMLQLTQEQNFDDFKMAKKKLDLLLSVLNEKLNRRLFASTGRPEREYQSWLASHQPFHWLAEYYQIINDNHGFDVIIGNPPYVEYSKTKKLYTLDGYETLECGNIYAQVLERGRNILNHFSYNGWIVPVSVICTDRTLTLQSFLKKHYHRHIATFDIFPSKIFEGAAQRVAIIILSLYGKRLLTSKYYRWNQSEREQLTSVISYTESTSFDVPAWTPRINHRVQSSIVSKLETENNIENLFISKEQIIYIHRIINNFVKAVNFEPYFKKSDGTITHSEDFKVLTCSNKDVNTILAFLNSNLFYWYWRIHGDGFHCGFKDIFKFRYSPVSEDKNIKILVETLVKDLKRNSLIKTRNQKATGLVYLQTFFVGKSKPIIDEIDKVLAKHYGFTEEELDFIINYDIKYRMGDELNPDE
ncbi:MAG: Eco57I restriction-modification methylase domain-containing protein [Bacteroidales bacterium]|nr:Eco57I restriction-modification methylase domain-containing protein [Bacteroidales bacterium]